MHQHGVARLHGIGRLDQVVRGHALQQGRRDGVGSHAVGHVGDEIGWGNAEVGVGAGGVRGHHAVTDGQCGHVVADGGDGAAHLGPDDERQLARIQAGPEVGVDEVDADRLGLDQYLAGAGGGLEAVRRSSGLRVRRSRQLRWHTRHPSSTPIIARVKLARPDVFHPRIVLAGCAALPEGDGDDAGLLDGAAQPRPARPLAALGRPGHPRRRPGDPAGHLGLHRASRRVPRPGRGRCAT